MLPRFGLEGFERDYPAALSGGMRQRAALLRTWLTGCDTLLLDEPFGALDALTRRELQDWLLRVWQEFGRTVVFITHDVEEAVYLADRVIRSQRPSGYGEARADGGLCRAPAVRGWSPSPASAAWSGSCLATWAWIRSRRLPLAAGRRRRFGAGALSLYL